VYVVRAHDPRPLPAGCCPSTACPTGARPAWLTRGRFVSPTACGIDLLWSFASFGYHHTPLFEHAAYLVQHARVPPRCEARAGRPTPRCGWSSPATASCA
jgi:hypothetical protein